MIIPSIDLQSGDAVQLRRGDTLVINAGDPRPIAERFGMVGEIAAIDLDAARGTGSNAAVIRELLTRADCRVGGGIRDYESAAAWLDAGAARVIIGTAAEPDLLRRLPRDRVIAAVDERAGSVVDHGWRRTTSETALDRIRRLRSCVGGFLVTFVDGEGCMGGLPIDRITEVVEAAGDARVTVAGGVRQADEIRIAHELGADVQVGMALYSGAMTIADAVIALIRTHGQDGLWPTVVTDERGIALGLAWSNASSLAAALTEQRGIYWSRSRNALWRKGETSGASQQLLRVDLDCDRDALRFTVRQAGTGFCHRKTRSCFDDGHGLGRLERRLNERIAVAPAGSYTARVMNDPQLLRGKLIEEAGELADAEDSEDVASEAADLLYFALVRLSAAGVSLAEVERVLDRRERRVTRRPGLLKESPVT